MIIKSDIKTEFSIINAAHVTAIGTYDDPNGNYFMLTFRMSSGNITWKYDSLKQRDEKLAEALSLMEK